MENGACREEKRMTGILHQSGKNQAAFPRMKMGYALTVALISGLIMTLSAMPSGSSPGCGTRSPR